MKIEENVMFSFTALSCLQNDFQAVTECCAKIEGIAGDLADVKTAIAKKSPNVIYDTSTSEDDVFSDTDADTIFHSGHQTAEDVGTTTDSEDVGMSNDAENVGTSNDAEDVGTSNDAEDVGTTNDAEDVGMSNDAENVGKSNDAEDVDTSNDAEDVGMSNDAEDVGTSNDAEDVGTSNDAEDVGTSNDAEDVGTSNDAEDVGTSNDAEDVGTSNDAEDVRTDNASEDVSTSNDAEDVGMRNNAGNSGCISLSIQNHRKHKDTVKHPVLRLRDCPPNMTTWMTQDGYRMVDNNKRVNKYKSEYVNSDRHPRSDDIKLKAVKLNRYSNHNRNNGYNRGDIGQCVVFVSSE